MSKTVLPERNLDVLRAAAVLCVLANHIWTVWDVHALDFMNWATGRIGVLLFFVHTALVLMSSLERGGRRPDWVRVFYLRRALRIYPLSLATILLVVLIGIPPHSFSRALTGHPVPPTFTTLLTNVTLTQNVFNRPDVLGVLWSLPLEVQMYLVLPLCFIIAKRGMRSVFGALAVTVLAGLFVRFASLPGLWRLNVALFGPCFMGGVLAYAMLRTGVRPRLPAWSWPVLLAACVPLFAAFHPSDATPERGWLFCLGVGCAIPLAGNLPASIATRVAHVVCTYSYGIYLLHQPALWVAFTLMKSLPLAVQWGACIVLLMALPVAFYHLIEHPGIQLGKRLAAVLPRSSSLDESRPPARALLPN